MVEPKSCLPSLTIDKLDLEAAPERLGHGVVIAVRHRRQQLRVEIDRVVKAKT